MWPDGKWQSWNEWCWQGNPCLTGIPHLSRSTENKPMHSAHSIVICEGPLKHMLYLYTEAISVGMFNSCLYPPPLKSPLQISKNITQLKWRRQSASRRLSGNKPPLSTCGAVEGCHACHPLAQSCCWKFIMTHDVSWWFKPCIWKGSYIQSSDRWCQQTKVTIFCCNEAMPANLHRTSWS